MNEQLEAILWELLRESDAPFTTLEFIVEEAKEKIQAMAPSVPQVCPQPIESAPKGRLRFAFGEVCPTTGDKVRYLDKNGHDHEREYARKSGLVKDQVYVVAREEMGSWCSHFELVGLPGKTFNTVMFAIEELVENPPPPGEVAPQVCPNCEEMRRIVTEFFDARDEEAASGSAYLGGDGQDDDELIAREEAAMRRTESALAALSTLKSKEPQN